MRKIFRKFEVIKMLKLFKQDGFSDIDQAIEMLNNNIRNDTDIVFKFDFDNKNVKLIGVNNESKDRKNNK